MPDLTITRGDNRTVKLALTDPNGVGADPNDPTTWPPVDLTGCSLWFYVKESSTDSDAEAVISKDPADITLTDAPGGKASVAIIPTDTDSLALRYLDVELIYEVQLRDTANIIQTPKRGTILIESDIVLTPNLLDPTPSAFFTYNPTTDAGKVRLLSQDFDAEEMIFSDSEIQAFLDLNGANVLYAAAQALEVIAANEIYVQKRIKILDLWTDGPREAEQLIKLAASYRQQAVASPVADVSEMFDWAEQVFDSFTWRERIYNEFLRGL